MKKLPDPPPGRRPFFWPALATEIILMIVIATAVWWFAREYQQCREFGASRFQCAIGQG